MIDLEEGGCGGARGAKDPKSSLTRQTDGTTVQLSPKQASIPALWRAYKLSSHGEEGVVIDDLSAAQAEGIATVVDLALG